MFTATLKYMERESNVNNQMLSLRCLTNLFSTVKVHKIHTYLDNYIQTYVHIHIYLHNYICTYIHTYITTCILFLYLVLKTSFIQLSILIFGLSDLIPGYLVFSAFIMALKFKSQLIHQPNFIQFSYIFLFLNSRSLYLII